MNLYSEFVNLLFVNCHTIHIQDHFVKQCTDNCLVQEIKCNGICCVFSLDCILCFYGCTSPIPNIWMYEKFLVLLVYSQYLLYTAKKKNYN